LCIIVLNLRRPGTALVCGVIALLLALVFPFAHVSDFQFVTDYAGEDQHMRSSRSASPTGSGSDRWRAHAPQRS